MTDITPKLQDDKTEEVQDPDGLEEFYDIVLLGTGMVESIIACAAAKVGKTVLHLDKNNFYGRECAGGSLEQFLSRSKANFEGSLKLDIDVAPPPPPSLNVSTQEAFLKKIDFASLSEQVNVQERVISFMDIPSHLKASEVVVRRHHIHPSCLGYSMERQDESIGSDSDCHPCFLGYIKDHRMTSKRAWSKSRSFNIDSSSRLLLGSSISIDAMISSGVSKYLEFKSVEGLFYVSSSEDVCSVPCSKGDIFTSKLLNALEKRTFMKFLQSTIDWGQCYEGNMVTTLNERELAQGRALKRPQNKKEKLLPEKFTSEELENFHSYLAAHKIPDRLQNIIVHALCLHGVKCVGKSGTFSDRHIDLETKDALYFLYQHIHALGKFGETAFLAVLYGSSELPQAFCRMCAVWGGTYVLRRTISSVSILEIDSLANSAKVQSIRDSTGRIVKCGNFVCNIDDWPLRAASDSYSFVLTHTCITDAPLFDLSRSVGIIPPSMLGIDNSHAIYIVQLDSSVAVAPEGAFVVHVSTTIIADGSSIGENDMSDSPLWFKIMDNAKFLEDAALLMKKTISFFKLKRNFIELCFSTSIRPLHDIKNIKLNTEDGLALSNVAICGETKATIHSNDCFQQAKKVFEKLFPDDLFFAHATDAEDDNFADKEDQDETELELALKNVKLSEVDELSSNNVKTLYE